MHDSFAARPDTVGIHRLFFALWPDDATRAHIAAAAARLRARSPGGRWIAVDRYHLTLEFLGTYRQLPPWLVDTACAAAASAQAPGFVFTLDRVGSFRTRSHLWWLGCERPDPLLPLWTVLRQSLVERGIAVAPGPYIPHVTVARGSSRPPPVDAAVSVVWPVTGFALIHSQSGARDAYRVVRQWSLATG